MKKYDNAPNKFWNVIFYIYIIYMLDILYQMNPWYC